MLDFLWSRGDIMVAGRSGVQKRWDLAERCLPDWTPRDQWDEAQVVGFAAQKAIRALGAATPQQIKQHYTRGRYPNLPHVLKALEKEGQIERVQVEDLKGDGTSTPPICPCWRRSRRAISRRARRCFRPSTT